MVQEIGNGQIQPNCSLNAEHQNDRQTEGMQHEQKDKKNSGDREQIDLPHVVRDSVHQVVGAHTLTGKIIAVGIILLCKITDLLYQRKGFLAFIRDIDRQNKAAVMVGDQLRLDLRGDDLDWNGGTEDIDIGYDVGDMREFFQLVGKCSLFCNIVVGNKQDI